MPNSHSVISETLGRLDLRRDLIDALSEPAMPIEFYFDSIDEDFGGIR